MHVPQLADLQHALAHMLIVKANQLCTRTAEPEEDPPGTRSGLAGFTGVPYRAFSPLRLYACSTPPQLLSALILWALQIYLTSR